jgi:hypothetical protein
VAKEIAGTPHWLPPEDAPLNENTFTAFRELLTSQAEDELGFMAGFFTFGGPDNQGCSLADWYLYATKTDLDKMPRPGGQTPWEYLDSSARQLAGSVSTLSTLAQVLEARWPLGDGSFAYMSELSELIEHLNTHLVGGDDYNTSEMDMGTLLEAAYGLEVMFKRDLAELARKTSDAFESIEHTGIGNTLLKVALVTVGVAAAIVSGGAAVVVESFTAGALTAAGSTLGSQIISDGLDQMEIGGMEGKDVVKNFATILEKIVESYQTAAKKLADDLEDMVTNLSNETKNEKFNITVPGGNNLASGFDGASLGMFRNVLGGPR